MEASARATEAETPRRPGEPESDLTPTERDMLDDAVERGDLSDLPPDLRKRAETFESLAEESGRAYEGEEGPQDRGEPARPLGGTEIPTRPFDLPEIQEAALSAQAAHARLPPNPGATPPRGRRRGRTGKAVADVEGGPPTTSGSAGSKIDTVERAREAAVDAGAVREHPFDTATGGPGYYHVSHAEVQTIIDNPGRPAAVRHPDGMCPGCQDFFRRHAAATGQRIVVADDLGVKVFLEDGSVHSIEHADTEGFGTSPLSVHPSEDIPEVPE